MLQTAPLDMRTPFRLNFHTKQVKRAFTPRQKSFQLLPNYVAL